MEFYTVWVYDTQDPMVYRMFIPEDLDDPESEVISWDMGRELFREAIDKHRLGGRMHILVSPPIDKGIQVVFTSEDGIEAALLVFNEAELTAFHNMTHEKITAEREIEITMNRLLFKVNA